MSRPLIDGSKQAHLVLARPHHCRISPFIAEVARCAKELAVALPINTSAEQVGGHRLRLVGTGSAVGARRKHAKLPR